MVAILGKDEFVGEGCLAGQKQRVATATAMSECEIMQIEKATIVSALHDKPVFSAMFVRYLLGRTIRVEEDLVDQLFNSSEKRLARALLLLASFEGTPDTFIAKISQETLADMIGTTRSRVSFFMNKFRRLDDQPQLQTKRNGDHTSLELAFQARSNDGCFAKIGVSEPAP